MNRQLARFLRRRGAAADEIALAEAEGWLSLLTIDRLLFEGRPRYDLAEVAKRAGADPEVAARMWRALGFPDLPAGEAKFTDQDVAALRSLERRLERETFVDGADPADDLVRQVRAIGVGMARVAEVLSDQITDAVREARETGLTDEEIAGLLASELDWPTLARLHDYALRLQVRAAAWRKLAAESSTGVAAAEAPLAVGFLDLVGYTALSQELDDDQLWELVARFEAVAYDTIAEAGGRVVKTIGDEVMFVADAPVVAASIALRLSELTEGDDLLPLARAGLAYGRTVAREGDYYGPVVNLAHRLVELARPGNVVVASELHEALSDQPGFRWSRMRARRIRGIGRVETWSLQAEERATPDSVAPHA